MDASNKENDSKIKELASQLEKEKKNKESSHDEAIAKMKADHMKK